MSEAETDPAEFRQQILRWLVEEFHDGRRFVKAHHVADEFNVSNTRAGANLRELCDGGPLGIHTNGGGGAVFRLQDRFDTKADVGDTE